MRPPVRTNAAQLYKQHQLRKATNYTNHAQASANHTQQQQHTQAQTAASPTQHNSTPRLKKAAPTARNDKTHPPQHHAAAAAAAAAANSSAANAAAASADATPPPSSTSLAKPPSSSALAQPSSACYQPSAKRVEAWARYCEYFHVLSADIAKTSETASKRPSKHHGAEAQQRSLQASSSAVFERIEAALSADKPLVRLASSEDGSLVVQSCDAPEGQRIISDSDLALVRAQLRAAALVSPSGLPGEAGNHHPFGGADPLRRRGGKATTDPATSTAAIETLLWFGLALGDTGHSSRGGNGGGPNGGIVGNMRRPRSTEMLASLELSECVPEWCSAIAEVGFQDDEAAEEVFEALGKFDDKTSRGVLAGGVAGGRVIPLTIAKNPGSESLDSTTTLAYDRYDSMSSSDSAGHEASPDDADHADDLEQLAEPVSMDDADVGVECDTAEAAAASEEKELPDEPSKQERMETDADEEARTWVKGEKLGRSAPRSKRRSAALLPQAARYETSYDSGSGSDTGSSGSGSTVCASQQPSPKRRQVSTRRSLQVC